MSWTILYLYFDKVQRVNLGTLFLALDIPAFVWAIYLTGAQDSWLFFLLYIRVADQTSTSFKRALRFSHVGVASYCALVLYLAFVERLSQLLGRPVATGVFAADMAVTLHNDGPVTIVIDSRLRE